MTTTISSVCRKCGVIAKSGKISCCGRGGSWFRNCRNAGNGKLRYTWYEGIRACKTRAQLKTANGQQPNTVQQLTSPNNGFGTVNSKAVIRDTKTSPISSTPLPDTKTIITSPNASINESTIMSDSTYTNHDIDSTDFKELDSTVVMSKYYDTLSRLLLVIFLYII